MANTPAAGSKIAQTQQVKDLFPDEYGYKDSKEGSKTTPTRWTLMYRKSKDTAASVLKTLHQNKINAVPIWDAEGKKWAGFVDDQDLIIFAFKTFLNELKGDKEKKDAGGKFELFNDQEIKAMYEKLQKMGNFVESIINKSNATVADVASFNDRNAWRPVKWTDSLLTVIEIFATTKVRRIPVIGDNAQVQHVITRSDIVEWMHENMNNFPELKATPLHRLACAKKEVYCLPLSAHAIDGFRLMAQHKVSAVGILDNDGKVAANLKLTDVKRADGNIGPRLSMTLPEYHHAQEKKRNLILSNLAAFSGAVNMLCQHTSRRMFVFDPQNNKPAGVFSQSDAIEELHRYLKSQETATTKAA